MKTKLALFGLATSVATVASLFAQQPAAAIVKHTAAPAAAVPVAGYVLASGTVEIRPILGTAGKARLGDPIAAPAGAGRLYLPPRQQYALVESNSDRPMAVWNLLETFRKGSLAQAMPIAGSLVHADLVAFSPRGEAAALYSKDSGRLQIISDFPAKPTLARELSLSGLGEASQLALSDDGARIAAQLTDARLMYSSQDGRWQPLSGQYSPAAWSFVPNAHDLVIADPSQDAIAVYRQADGGAYLFSLQELRADRLSFTKDGLQLLAASSSDGNLWVVQLPSGTLTSLATGGKLDTLTCLRDGWTFLLSSSPPLSLVKVVSRAQAEALIPPSSISQVESRPERHAVLF
jgi:hypothetical protein